MRLSIAAGILAVSLASDAHLARAERKNRLQAFGKGLGSTGAGFGRRLGKRNRKSPGAINGGVVLKNNNGKGAKQECNPASFDADVGVLACGLGQYCQESAHSKLGGVCASSTPIDLDRNLQDYDYDDEFDLSYYCVNPSCDCSEFDYSTGMGIIDCGPIHECYNDCDPPLCSSYILSINALGGTNFTAAYCLQYSGASYDQAFCYEYDSASSYPGEAVAYIDGVKCNNVNETNYGCTIFDCTNTVRNIAGSTCEGDIFLPERFYDNCTDTDIELYSCDICDFGTYVSIPDGMVGAYTCEQVELAAQIGLIGPDECPLVTPLIAANCGCLVPPTPATSPVPTPAPSASPTPDNDICDGAVMLGLNNGELVEGSTIGATLDEVPGCFSDELESVRGVWYTVLGADVTTSINLCEGTTYDTVITIFEGSCGDLFCIGGNDDTFIDNCESAASEYSWFAEADKTYYVLVSRDFFTSTCRLRIYHLHHCNNFRFYKTAGSWVFWCYRRFWYPVHSTRPPTNSCAYHNIFAYSNPARE
jgi:hypothetical protein